MLPINHWYDRFFKIILIIGFFLILVILTILLGVGPALSYEFSIYAAYPWYFWVLLLSAILCGQVVIFGSAITQSKKNYWLFGLFTILVSNTLLLFLPKIRGYIIYGSGDVLTHIGYMKDILSTSNIGGNHYPIDHILGVIIQLISGLSIPEIIYIIPPIFSFFFILSMYFVGKTIFLSKYELMILVLLASILIFGNFNMSFTPNSQAIFLVPLMLYLAFKIYYGMNINKYYISLFLISSLIVFYHPLVTIMVILILCLMQIMQYILEKYEKRILKKVNYTYIIVFMLTVFSIWSTYLYSLIWVMKPIIGRLFGDDKIESELQKNLYTISQVTIDPIYLLKLILNLYGHWILLGILSLLCIGLILKSMKNQKTESNFYNGVLVLGFIVFFILSMVILYINNNFGFERIYFFATLFSLLLIPIGISLFLFNNPNNKSLSRKKIITLLGVIFIIFCVTYFSTFNLYFSPIIKEANQQVPRSNYIGMSTFFSHRNESLSIFELGLATFRYYDAIYGYSAGLNNGFEENYMLPPDHFGYQNNTLSRIFYNNSKYLLLNDQGRELNPQINPEFEYKWSFGPKDFEHLKIDNKVQQVYSNGDLEIFML